MSDPQRLYRKGFQILKQGKGILLKSYQTSARHNALQ